MQTAVCPIITFPDIAWWAATLGCDVLQFDKAEHFRKMTGRNRYCIAGANGLIKLSVSLLHGRNQRAAMKDIQISNDSNWQVQHWRTLTSVYKRSPYFDFYEGGLNNLFETPFTYLIDFNLASIHWLKGQLNTSFEEVYIEEYRKDYGSGVTDIREIRASKTNKTDFPLYYQLFKERTGFLPNMSMLDLLFAEGPYAMRWVIDNKDKIMEAVKAGN